MIYKMIYRKIDEHLTKFAANELMDKELQHLFDKILQARQPQEWQGFLSMIGKHPQPLTLLYLLLCGYFKLLNRRFVKGEKIDWQDDVAWLRANIPDSNLLHIPLKEIEVACCAFNGDLTAASKKYRELFYQNFWIRYNLEHTYQDLNYRLQAQMNVAINLEPENYDVPLLSVSDITPCQKLQKEYIAGTPLFHVYCDAVYFKYFAKKYIESVKSVDGDYFILAVVGNMDDEARTLAQQLAKEFQHFYVIEDDIPEQFLQPHNLPTWCTCRRFLYLETLFNQLDGLYLLTTDIDVVFSAGYQKAVEYGRDAAISYSCPKAEIFEPRGAWVANQLFLTDTEFARQFCRAISHYIRQKMAETDRIYWYLDQFALFRLWHQLGIANHPECKNIDDVIARGVDIILAAEYEFKLQREEKIHGTHTELLFDKESLRPILNITQADKI